MHTACPCCCCRGGSLLPIPAELPAQRKSLWQITVISHAVFIIQDLQFKRWHQNCGIYSLTMSVSWAILLNREKNNPYLAPNISKHLVLQIFPNAIFNCPWISKAATAHRLSLKDLFLTAFLFISFHTYIKTLLKAGCCPAHSSRVPRRVLSLTAPTWMAAAPPGNAELPWQLPIFITARMVPDPRGGAVLPSPPQAMSLLVKSSPSAHFISLLRSRTGALCSPSTASSRGGMFPRPCDSPCCYSYPICHLVLIRPHSS